MPQRDREVMPKLHHSGQVMLLYVWKRRTHWDMHVRVLGCNRNVQQQALPGGFLLVWKPAIHAPTPTRPASALTQLRTSG
jgi:hypothetical protein